MPNLLPPRAKPAIGTLAYPLAMDQDASAQLGQLGLRYRYELVFLAFLAVAGGMCVFIGLAEPLGNFAHDTFFLLSNAYRVAHGQVPSRDFSSAWGPVMFLIEAAGLLMSGMRPSGIGDASALFAGLFAAWAFLLVRPKFSSAMACLAGIYTFLLMAAPFPLGNTPLDFGYAMIYNRYGYAIFGLIMLECVAIPGGASRGIWSALSTGAAFGLLAFLKISFAMVAAPFIVLSLLGDKADVAPRLKGLCGGFAFVLLPVLAYLRFDLFDVWRDLSIAATSRNMSLQLLHPIAVPDAAQLIVIAAVGGLTCWGTAAAFASRLAQASWALFFLGTIAAGYLLLISNQQGSQFPLNGYAAMALAAACVRFGTAWPPGRFRISPQVLRIVLLVACVGPVCLGSSLSLAGAALVRLRPQLAGGSVLVVPERGTALTFRNIAGPKTTEISGKAYVAAMQDGLALLRRELPAHTGVLALDEFSPFNYLLDRPTPRGGIAAAAFDYIFSDAAHPSPARFLGDAQYVIVRKYIEPANVDERSDVEALLRIYGPALRTNYRQIAETVHWVLWKHK